LWAKLVNGCWKHCSGADSILNLRSIYEKLYVTSSHLHLLFFQRKHFNFAPYVVSFGQLFIPNPFNNRTREVETKDVHFQQQKKFLCFHLSLLCSLKYSLKWNFSVSGGKTAIFVFLYICMYSRLNKINSAETDLLLYSPFCLKSCSVFCMSIYLKKLAFHVFNRLAPS
jgi:hypothetical protein